MAYFKIIQNDNVIDVGYVFLKWNKKYSQPYACDVQDAELVMSEVHYKVYHPEWLKKPPEEATGYEEAIVTVINETEYRDLLDQLFTSEEPVPIPKPEDVTPEEEEDYDRDKPEEERPVSVPEMRRIIADQQAQIEMLTDCILEMSEVIYNE